MERWRRQIKLMPRLWLLMVLLAAQGLVLAHGVDHAINSDAALCAICSVSHGVDDVVGAETPSPSTAPARMAIRAVGFAVAVTGPARSHTARGPPATL